MPRSMPSSWSSNWGWAYRLSLIAYRFVACHGWVWSQDDLEGEAGRAAAADERGDLVPVHVIGDGLGGRRGDPQSGQLPGPPVVDERLIVVKGLVPALVHFPSPAV